MPRHPAIDALSRQVEDAARSLAAADFAALTRTAATACSAVGNLGAAELSADAAALRLAAEQRNTPAAVTALVRLADGLDRWRGVRRAA